MEVEVKPMKDDKSSTDVDSIETAARNLIYDNTKDRQRAHIGGSKMTQTKRSVGRVAGVRILGLIVGIGLLAVGCTSSTTASDETVPIDPTISAEYQALEAELQTVTAERNALSEDAALAANRYEKSLATQALLVEIIDDPDAFGTKDEVLAALDGIAAEGAVMDDTAFGAVQIPQAWANTLYGNLDAVIETSVTWMSDDGTNSGSLWTWIGTAGNGEPFELIGVDLTNYNDESQVTEILMDWPYDGAFV